MMRRTSIAGVALCALACAQEPEEQPSQAEVALGEAAAKAAKKNKRVLVTRVGADEGSAALGDAIRKHRTVSRLIRYEFVVAEADDVVAKRLELGAPPAFAVLDARGGVLVRHGLDGFQTDDGFDPSAFAAELEKHKAPPLDAEKVLIDALAQAEASERNVLLHFDAPW